MELAGRKLEVKQIQQTYFSVHNEFVAVYGRRRVGKTYLVKTCLDEKMDFYYTGIYQIGMKTQIQKIMNTLEKYSGVKESARTWFDVFDHLKSYLLSLKKDVVCVFIDELPWMETRNSNFIAAFGDFFNMWDSLNPQHVLLKFYVCGSATTWMIDKIIHNKGGLHNRLTATIHLKPFTLEETKEYFNGIQNFGYSSKEITDIYMIVGGIPYYLSMFTKNEPISVQINRLFFQIDAPLQEEYDVLFTSLFDESKNYQVIIKLLSEHPTGLTRDEIMMFTKIEGGCLTECLENLVHCDFICKYNLPGNKKKGALYQLIDLYVLFYYQFVLNWNYDTNYFTTLLSSAKLQAWKGYAFEKVCLLHVDSIKKALSINGISSAVYQWYGVCPETNQKYQIDLIIDRADHVMNICEMKYSDDVYRITPQYSAYLQKRMSFFREQLHTTKTLKNTVVTSFGIDCKEASQPDYVLTLEDLFC